MTRFPLVLAALTLVFTPIAAGQGVPKSAVALGGLEGERFDVAFMSQAIAHLEGGLELARLASRNGTRREVREAAQAAAAERSKEAAQLSGWLKSWYDAAPDPAQVTAAKADLKPAVDQARAGMTPMQGHAMPIDSSFLNGMTSLNRDLIALCRLAVDKAARPELKAFARDAIAARTKESEQFQAWIKAGYL